MSKENGQKINSDHILKLREHKLGYGLTPTEVIQYD